MDIGIFGVTANPPHTEHMKAILKASEKTDQIWVSPVYNHAFAKKFIDYSHRYNMLQLMLSELGNEKILLKELDKQYFLSHNDIVYSYNLLKYLKSSYPEHNFKLVIGEDNYIPEVWQKFYKHSEIEKEFGLIILKDSGTHSSHIREDIAQNRDFSENLTTSVVDYIKKHNLYEKD